MGSLALMLVIVVAIVLGIVVQLAGVTRSGYDGLITGIAVVGGAIIAGQWLGSSSTWGPQFDGLYLLPALIGGVVLGAIANLAVRFAFPPTAAAPDLADRGA
jgi:hypothetical protein